jgi:hypothetical protein
MGAPIGTVVCYGVSLICSSVIFAGYFKRIPPIFSTSLISYIEAGAAILLSKFVYNMIYNRLGGIISLGIAILISAVIYIALSALLGTLPVEKNDNIGKIIQISA